MENLQPQKRIGQEIIEQLERILATQERERMANLLEF